MAGQDLKTALIVGAGSGLSAALARRMAGDGLKVALAARSTADIKPLADEIGATTFDCDASRREDVEALFIALDDAIGVADVVVYNPSYRTRGALIDLDPDEVQRTLTITAFGGFLVAQQAARRMLPRGRGCIVFTGASASVKGYPLSAPFAMGKFALRGLAQSIGRELQPKGIHVAHVVIDGGIKSARRAEPADAPDSLLDPEDIAATYMHVIRQPRSAWSTEVEVRPWVERF